MIKAILIDDESIAVSNLENFLYQFFNDEIQIVGKAFSVDEGKELIVKHHPDVIFLDIEMPGKTGFDLLIELQEIDFEVIFVTAYGDYGIKAIKFSALDYLLKPIDVDELKAAVTKVKKQLEKKKKNESVYNLINYLANENDRNKHKIAVSSVKETRFIPVGEIIRCESSNSYTTFFLKSNESCVSSSPLYEYEQMLTKYGFIRTHQSHLVNAKYIKSLVNEDGCFLCLQDGSSVPVSRQKKESVKKSLL